MKSIDGHVSNKAAGNNDLGSLLKEQFDPTLRPKNNAFDDVHERQNRMGKRVVRKRTPKNSAGVGLDFSRMTPEIEVTERSRSRSARPIETSLKISRNSAYLYQVLQPELSDRHSHSYRQQAKKATIKKDFV